MNWTPRLARLEDIPALETLIPLSVRKLQADYYSPAQLAAALGPVYGVDRQLIRDGTYFVVENAGEIAGCGGWSRRKTLYGGDSHRAAEDEALDPKREPARIRAFFVHPDWARKGIGQSILHHCEAEALNAGYGKVELVANLAGVPLYTKFGYAIVERYEVPMKDGLSLAVVRMAKRLAI